MLFSTNWIGLQPFWALFWDQILRILILHMWIHIFVHIYYKKYVVHACAFDMFMDEFACVYIFSLSDPIWEPVVLVVETYSFFRVRKKLLKRQGGTAIFYSKGFGSFFFFFSIIVCSLTCFCLSVQLVCFVVCCYCCCCWLLFEGLELEPRALHVLNRSSEPYPQSLSSRTILLSSSMLTPSECIHVVIFL